MFAPNDKISSQAMSISAVRSAALFGSSGSPLAAAVTNTELIAVIQLLASESRHELAISPKHGLNMSYPQHGWLVSMFDLQHLRLFLRISELNRFTKAGLVLGAAAAEASAARPRRRRPPPPDQGDLA
jgi:hypothetical protein